MKKSQKAPDDKRESQNADGTTLLQISSIDAVVIVGCFGDSVKEGEPSVNRCLG
jgi:hypothetical protein